MDIQRDEGFQSHTIARLFGDGFSAATDVQLLYKGHDSFDTIFNALRKAERLICLEFYIFRNDGTGEELAEILREKSSQGVQVYLLHDHFGSIGTPRKFWQGLRTAGVQIRASRPFKWSSPFHYVHRDHKKLIIIDNKRAFTGGLNIANEYRGFHLRRKSRGWRDTGVMLEGPIVGRLFDIFRKSWTTWGGGGIAWSPGAGKEEQHRTGAISLPAIPIFVSSSRGRRRLRRILFYSINHAVQSIFITTAYFTPSWRMVQTLEDAVARGVRVRLLVPGETDVPAAAYAGKSFFTRLLRAGAEIYTYRGSMLHAKSFIFDECWSIVGSTNLDFQSLRYNDEGNVGILDRGFASEMTAIFDEDLSHSVQILREDWDQRPFSEKAKEFFYSLFRRRL
ncbi:MAG: phospholipase D-like domain-containing protein [Thermodesulfovibrionales bacterium]|jgi:cardiolipin synthase